MICVFGIIVLFGVCDVNAVQRASVVIQSLSTEHREGSVGEQFTS